MYCMYRQLHPPTGMEHCVYCKFVDGPDYNLVVAGINQLHVYRLNMESEIVPKSTPDSEKVIEIRKRMKLESLMSFSLHGSIMSLQSVRLAGASRDCLLISFRDAKLSLVEYDPGTHDLKLSSLHYFEDEDLKGGACQLSLLIPSVRVDPEGRCAAMMIYGTRLVILPFRKDTVTDDSLDGVPSSSRPPIMSSYIIDLRTLDEKVTNVIDFQFLHGYYEPTVLVLYEPLPTWSGRVAVRKDSCSIVAISLNIQEKVHPIIWSLSGLPYDCFSIHAVPKPIGGVLVFAFNSLLYLNQSFPPYGVSLNSIINFSTDFLLKPQEGVKISLDCAQASFISYDKMVISLKGGELYVLTMVIDEMRAVRSFHLDKAAASVLTTCMCVCEEGYLFLGSRLGNSLLLKYTEKAVDNSGNGSKKEKADEPPQKKRKDDIGDWMASNVAELDEMDELEVYGSDLKQSGAELSLYSFEVCDSIMNIGPCGQITMGEPAFLSEEFSHGETDPDIELVSTSGYGKNGAISVLQRNVRPQVVTTFELPGCTNMWTVVGPPTDPNSKKPEEEEVKKDSDGDKNEEESEEKKEEKEETKEEVKLENTHALLILSREDSSMILQTGQEIMELDHSGFSTQGPTLYAGNIGGDKYIIQVSSNAIRLLDGVNQLQLIPLELGSPLVSCAVADPHVIVRTQEGNLMLCTLKPDTAGSGARLTMSKPQLPQQSAQIQSMCLYRDISGMFVTSAEKESRPASPVREAAKPILETSISMDKSTVDDEDDMLYGDSDVTMFSTATTAQENKARSTKSVEVVREECTPTFWMILSRVNGVLEIYSMPDFELSFMVKNFPMGPKVLVDTGLSIDQAVRTSASTEQMGHQEIPEVRELLVVGLGKSKSRPHILARVDEDLYVYEAFTHAASAAENHLRLRFKKIPHGLLLRTRKDRNFRKKPDGANGVQEGCGVQWLRPFDDVSGYSGVFVCGPYPHWLIMGSRGMLRTHPMSIDGTVSCFTPFHNVNCPKGFLYFNKKGELRICVLPTHLSYDAPWPVRKVPLRCSPHFVVYHPDSKTYSVVTSTSEPNNRVVRVIGDGEKEFETLEKDSKFIYPTIEKFSIQLFSPVSWEPIPNTKLETEDFEHVMCIKTVVLRSEGTLSGFKGYVAVGTNYNYNEEVTSRGRIIIYDVIEVVPEPGQPLTKNKMKIEYDKEQKGPVTAIDHVEGFLVSAVGQKIYIWQLKNNDLSGVAFIDTQIYIHTISTIKNIIIIADIYKSISLLRYQTDMKVLSLISRDIRQLEVYSVAFLVDNTNLGFLVSDRSKNLLVYTYQPTMRESMGGQRLLRRADINISSHVNTFFRIKCRQYDPSLGKKITGPLEKIHVTYFGSLDGSMGYLLPITEKIYRRLSMMQNALQAHVCYYAGANPKAYRLVQNECRSLNNPGKNVLDGDLLWKFVNLSVNEKSELCKRIGTNVEQITDDLLEIDRVTAHF